MVCSCYFSSLISMFFSLSKCFVEFFYFHVSTRKDICLSKAGALKPRCRLNFFGPSWVSSWGTSSLGLWSISCYTCSASFTSSVMIGSGGCVCNSLASLRGGEIPSCKRTGGNGCVGARMVGVISGRLSTVASGLATRFLFLIYLLVYFYSTSCSSDFLVGLPNVPRASPMNGCCRKDIAPTTVSVWANEMRFFFNSFSLSFFSSVFYILWN